MNLQIEYTTGAGALAVYARVRNFSGKYWNFTTLVWDIVESASSKVFFAEPDPINAAGFFTASFTPPVAGPWPVDIVRVSDGLIIGKADTDDAVNSIRGGITADHGAGLYVSSITGAFSITVTTVLTNTTTLTITPIPEVFVTLMNADKSVVLSQKTTSSMGVANFAVDAGTYTLQYRKAGYSFDDSTIIVTTANVTYTSNGVGLGLVFSPINIPGTQTLVISAKEIGVPWATGDRVVITPIANQFVGEAVLSSKQLRAVIGTDGIAGTWSTAVPPVWTSGVAVDVGLNVIVSIGDYYTSKVFTITSEPVKTLKGYFP